MRYVVAALLGFVSLFVLNAEVSAQEFTRRSFVLPKSSVEITGMPARPTMAGLDVSQDTDNVPFHFPIHVYFGVTNELTLGLIHEVGPFYPFGGPCLNCDDFYNDLGLGIIYSLIRSNDFELDLHAAAPEFLFFEPRVALAVRGGVLGRANLGSVVALVFDPSLQIGITNRPDDQGGNKDFWLPAWFYFQVTPRVAPFVGTGIGGRLEGFADNFAIPLEGGCIYSATQNIDIGGVFQFYNLAGHGGSADGRQISFLGRFRFGG